jgi:hypothetical protein
MIGAIGGRAAAGRGDALDRVEFAVAAAAVFLLPFNFLRPSFVFFTAADVLCVASLALRGLRGSLPIYPLGPGTPVWAFGALAMAASLLLSSAFLGDMARGLIVMGQYLFAFAIVPLVVLGRDWARTIALVKVFCASIVLMCLFGVYLIHVDGQRNTRFVSGNGRLRSFVERSNECASLIAMTAPLVLWLLRTREIGLGAAAFALASMFYATMLTGSNTGLFALVAALGLFVILTTSPIGAAARALATGAAAVAGLILFRDHLPEVFRKRVLSALESGDINEAGTFTDRLELSREAFAMARDHMLLGFGADQYRGVSDHHAPVHNAYLLLWNEGGLPAVAGFVATFVGIAIAALPALLIRGGRVHGAPLVCATISFFLLANAVPHVYGRFWMGPIVLGAAVALAYAASGPPAPVRGVPVPPARRRP